MSAASDSHTREIFLDGAGPVPNSKLLVKLPYRLSTEALYAATTEQERDLLRFEVNCAIQHFLEFDRPLFLEGLGIVIPSRSERTRAYPSGHSLVVRKEVIRDLAFEKCDDSGSIPEKFQDNLVETREFAERIYPRLPLAFHLRWSTQAMRSLLRAYFLSVRERLVTKGVSHSLSAIGTLYALHNRQGEVPNDWYAGADVLLLPRRAQVLQVLESNLCARPVFENAFEPLEALYGPPVKTLCLNLAETLKQTGIEVDDALPKEDSQVEVAVFFDRNALGGKGRLLWCTDGLRFYARREGNIQAAGSELIAQTPANAAPIANDPAGNYAPDTAGEEAGELHFDMASRLLALGWVMLTSTRTKSLRPGLGINCESPLLAKPKCLLTAVVATHAHPLSGMHLDSAGEYAYANIVGISFREAKLITSGKRIQLLAVLQLRNLDQVTYASRACLAEHTKLD